MEYISAEEFLKQPKKVQKVFIDWWQPSIGDLFINKCDYQLHVHHVDKICGDRLYCYDKWFSLKDVIPLLTEGQLRRFIEDKTGDIILFGYDDLTQPHSWYCHKTCKAYEIIGYKDLEEDLLQAYWKVSCEIAKEQI